MKRASDLETQTERINFLVHEIGLQKLFTYFTNADVLACLRQRGLLQFLLNIPSQDLRRAAEEREKMEDEEVAGQSRMKYNVLDFTIAEVIKHCKSNRLIGYTFPQDQHLSITDHHHYGMLLVTKFPDKYEVGTKSHHFNCARRLERMYGVEGDPQEEQEQEEEEQAEGEAQQDDEQEEEESDVNDFLNDEEEKSNYDPSEEELGEEEDRPSRRHRKRKSIRKPKERPSETKRRRRKSRRRAESVEEAEEEEEQEQKEKKEEKGQIFFQSEAEEAKEAPSSTSKQEKTPPMTSMRRKKLALDSEPEPEPEGE